MARRLHVCERGARGAVRPGWLRAGDELARAAARSLPAARPIAARPRRGLPRRGRGGGLRDPGRRGPRPAELMLLAVTYHYVAEEPPGAPRAIFPVTTALLARQIEELGCSFDFVSRDDLLRALDGEAGLPERAALVTFDDGLRCQVELALPVLDRLGVPGLFFVPGLPLAEGRVLDVHKVHRLREAMADEEILAALGTDAPAAPAGRHVYDDPLAAAVKELLAGRSPEELDDLLARVGATVGLDLYMSREQVAELERL